MLRRLLYSWIVNVAAIWVASVFVDGVDYSEDYWVLIVTGLVFGLVNFLVKPIIEAPRAAADRDHARASCSSSSTCSCSTSRAGSCSGFEISSFMSGIWATVIIAAVNWVLTQHLRPRRAAQALSESPKQRLLSWFAANGRDLPWRHTRDPYAMLVSEVMLQQTQVARVVPRWTAWLERWPTVEALAAAASRRRHPRLAGARLQPARRQPPPCRDRDRRARLAGRPDGAARSRPATRPTPWPASLRRAGATRGRERAARPGAQRPRVRPRVRPSAHEPRRTGLHRPGPALRRLPPGDDCPSRGTRFEPARKQTPYEGSFRQRRARDAAARIGQAAPGAELDDEAVAALAGTASSWTRLRRRASRDRGGLARLPSSATACAARPSPRPVKPRRSVVVARTATRSGSTPSAAASRARMSSRASRDARLLADQHAVGVDELEAGRPYARVRVREQLERVGAAVALVVGGKERADVAEPGGAEQRVGERVGDARRRPSGPTSPRGWSIVDAAEHERHAVAERVGVDADADAESRHPSGSWRLHRPPSKTVDRLAAGCAASASAWSKFAPTRSGSCASEASVTGAPARTHASQKGPTSG